MRTIFLIAALFAVSALNAQLFVPGFNNCYMSRNMFANNLSMGDSVSNKKWSFTSFSAISASSMFFRGGSASIFSVPVGIQLNRKLNNNLYAFATISAAPAYVNFNRSFINQGYNKSNPGNSFYGQNSMQVYSAASMGLMYVNDEKTFSVSGSISVGRSGNPFVPVNSTNSSRPVLMSPANR